MDADELYAKTLRRLGFHRGQYPSDVQHLIHACVEEVERAAGGPLATETFLHRWCWPPVELQVARPIASITTVVERLTPLAAPVTLNAADYRVVTPWRLRRLNTGANPTGGWGTEVTVAYAPVIDQDLRDRVLLDLIELRAKWMAVDRRQVGDAINITAPDYRERRDELLAQLSEGRAPIL
jgi:hypothetical protein